MFSKILITSWGIIQTQTIKAAQELGIKAAVISIPGQKNSVAEYLADEVWAAKETDKASILYDREALLEIAKSCKADAVHPGYGFLAEDLEFATELKKRNITFISSGLLNKNGIGFKNETKKLVQTLGVRTVQGSEPCKTYGQLKQAININNFKYPLVLKPEHGVGAAGVVIVHRETELEVSYRLITILADAHKTISKNVIVEEYFDNAKQIEVPVLRDKYGNIVVLPEVECSIQRRFNPIVNESPVSYLNKELIRQLHIDCRHIAEKFKFIGLIYIEFFITNNTAYFNGINCSIQPSYFLTYELTGINLLKHQIRLIAGEKLSFGEQDIKLKGHGVDVLIKAEDPEDGFLPSTGKIENDMIVNSLGVAVYKTLTTGDEILGFYEPQVAHVITIDNSRREAITKLKTALFNFVLEGVKSNLTFLHDIVSSDEFNNASYNLSFLRNPKIVQRLIKTSAFKDEKEIAALIAAVSLQNDASGRQKLLAEHKDESFSLWNLTSRILK